MITAFKLFIQKRGIGSTIVPSRCIQPKSNLNISTSNRKLFSARFTCKLQNPDTTYPNPSSFPSLHSLGSPEFSMNRYFKTSSITRMEKQWYLDFQATISSNTKGVYLSITEFIFRPTFRHNLCSRKPSFLRMDSLWSCSVTALQPSPLRTVPLQSGNEDQSPKSSGEHLAPQWILPTRNFNRGIHQPLSLGQILQIRSSCLMPPTMRNLQCHQQMEESYYLRMD